MLLSFFLLMQDTSTAKMLLKQSTPMPLMVGKVTFEVTPNGGYMLYHKTPQQRYFQHGGQLYGDYIVELGAPGYLPQKIAFTLNQPQLTITVILKADPRWTRIPNTSSVDLSKWAFFNDKIAAQIEVNLSFSQTIPTLLTVSDYQLKPSEWLESVLPQTLMQQFIPQGDTRVFEAHLRLTRHPAYVIFYLLHRPTEYHQMWLVDLTSLNGSQIRQLAIPTSEHIFVAETAYMYIHYSIWTGSGYKQSEPHFTLVTFDSALTILKSEDFVPQLKATLPFARGFEPLAATKSFDKILIRANPSTNYALYEYAVIDTHTQKASLIVVDEDVSDAVWLTDHILLLYVVRNGIFEYDARTHSLRKIASLREMNAEGLANVKFTPDAAYLVGLWDAHKEFLIFPLGSIYQRSE
jgi:hypothetical protein